MTDLHPRLKALMDQQLPQGFQLGEVIEVTQETTELSVCRGDERQTIVFEKKRVSDHFDNRTPWVVVNEGATWETVMGVLSETYHLWLVPGVDYSELEGIVEFGENQTVVKTVPLLNTALCLTGVLTFAVRKGQQFTLPSKPDLSNVRVQLALTSKVFETNQVIVGGMGARGRLAKAFVEAIIGWLDEVGISHHLTADLLLEEPPLEVAFDGISQWVAARVKGKPLVIRFRLT